MIISIILFTFMIFSLVSFLLLFPFGLYQYTIIPFVIFCIFLLAFRVWFYHRCRKYINLNKTIISIKDFIQLNDKNEGYIVFSSINNVYSSEGNDAFIRFDLKGFLFKKSFIRAFVVRQIRYNTISNKLKISKLFSIKLKCKCKYDKLYLVIDNHKYLVFSNNISKNTLLSSEISKSKFAAMYSSLRTYFSSNRIQEIDEKIYLEKYRFYKNF